MLLMPLLLPLLLLLLPPLVAAAACAGAAVAQQYAIYWQALKPEEPEEQEIADWHQLQEALDEAQFNACGLSPDTLYAVRVRACNSRGRQEHSPSHKASRHVLNSGRWSGQRRLCICELWLSKCNSLSLFLRTASQE